MNRVHVRNVVLDNCIPKSSEVVVESVGASKLEQLVTVLPYKLSLMSPPVYLHVYERCAEPPRGNVTSTDVLPRGNTASTDISSVRAKLPQTLGVENDRARVTAH